MLSSFAGNAMEMIVKDQEEFEKEHRFMQVYNSPLFPLCYIRRHCRMNRLLISLSVTTH